MKVICILKTIGYCYHFNMFPSQNFSCPLYILYMDCDMLKDICNGSFTSTTRSNDFWKINPCLKAGQKERGKFVSLFTRWQNWSSNNTSTNSNMLHSLKLGDRTQLLRPFFDVWSTSIPHRHKSVLLPSQTLLYWFHPVMRQVECN